MIDLNGQVNQLAQQMAALLYLKQAPRPLQTQLTQIQPAQTQKTQKTQTQPAQTQPIQTQPQSRIFAQSALPPSAHLLCTDQALQCYLFTNSGELT